MRRLFVVAVAAMAMLAFTPVAHAQGGAQKLPCSDSEAGGPGVLGNFVYTPSGNINGNCNFPGPAEGGRAVITPCSEVQPALTGSNVVITPSGHAEQHCDFPTL